MDNNLETEKVSYLFKYIEENWFLFSVLKTIFIEKDIFF